MNFVINAHVFIGGHAKEVLVIQGISIKHVQNVQYVLFLKVN